MRAVVGFLLLSLVASLSAQDSAFVLTTTDPGYHAPAFIGNGAFSLVASPLGTAPTSSFASGVYDNAPDDVPRIAALPSWNTIDVFDGQGWLNATRADTATLRGYRQTLDMYNGTLQTSYEWVDGERRTSVNVLVFVSRANPALAVVKLTLIPHFAGPLRISFSLRPTPAPQRLPLARLEHSVPEWTLSDVWYPGHVVVREQHARPNPTGGFLWLDGQTEGRGTAVAVAAAVAWPTSQRAVRVDSLASDGGVTLEASFTSTRETPLTFYKYVAIERSAVRARAVAQAAAQRRFDALLTEHRTAWHDLWRTDVIIEGDAELQRVIRAMLFYLLASVREGSDQSIPPMGLSTAGYYGHVFWDADTWMFPGLVALYPQLARSMVMFRHQALGAAQRNAQANGHRGAMYPWESDELGEETTPRFAWQNALYENHITGDVAMAQWQYYLATGDSAWLAQFGLPVLAATADFWVSRATLDPKTGRYGIDHIVSVDEGLIGVGNDTYTNAIARKNLELATLASRRVGRAPDPQWSKVAAGMWIPYDSAEQYHPTYDGAPPEKRGSVVPLLAFPLAIPMSEQAKRHDLESATRSLIKNGGGAMMGETLYPIIAAELGERGLVDTLVPLSYRGYVRPPFNALAETPRNDAVNFLTGTGGFLQQVVYGYTGLRLGDAGLSPVYRPVLPSHVTRLTLRYVPVRGRRFDIVVERDTLRFVPR